MNAATLNMYDNNDQSKRIYTKFEPKNQIQKQSFLNNESTYLSKDAGPISTFS